MKNTDPATACVLEPLPDYREFPQAEMIERAQAFHAELIRRRTVRDFDTRSVPREVIESCLLAAGTAPSGANQQPWFFKAEELQCDYRQFRILSWLPVSAPMDCW